MSETNGHTSNGDSHGGEGERVPFTQQTGRAESGLTKSKDARLVERAIKNGWMQGPFPMDETIEELQTRMQERGGTTLTDRTMVTTHQLQADADMRNKRAGVAIAVAMANTNLRAASDGGGGGGVQVNIQNNIREQMSEARDDEDGVARLYRRLSLGGSRESGAGSNGHH